MRIFFVLRFALILTLFAAFSTSVARAEHLRPSVDGAPTPVKATVFIVDVDEINSADQAFAANVYYAIQWRDPSHAHSGSDAIRKPLEAVWHPTVQILNQQRLWETFPHQVEISPSGDVAYRQRVWGYFSQPLRLHEFPFDQQKFTIRFVAVGMPPSEILFSMEGRIASGIAEKLSVADWTVTSYEVQTDTFRPVEKAPESAGFYLTFTAQRNAGYYVIKVIVPLILIVMMSWVVFWIDPTESGSQIGVSMTAMLTLIAYRFAVGTLLPKVSYLTRMDWFILLSTLLVFASMVEVVITSALAKRNQLRVARSIDYVARGLFPLAFLLTALRSFF